VFLGVDLGTGSVKTVLLDEDGSYRSGPRRNYSLHTPRPGWAEADPAEWWAALVSSVAGLDADGPIKGMAICGQMHGLALVDAAGEPVRAPILWPDTRSGAYMDNYRRLPERIRWRLANPVVTGMAGPSLLWVQQEEPVVYREAAHLLLPKDLLRHRLTGELSTDPSDASGTLLYDVLADGWFYELLDELGLRHDLLPVSRRSCDVAGHLLPTASTALRLRPGLPVATGAADTAASILGFGLTPGSVLLTVGTGGQIVTTLDMPVTDLAGTTHLYRTAHRSGWCLMAAVENVGLALETVRRVFRLEWPQVYDEAFAIPPGASGLRFAPYVAGERTPLLDPRVRAAWVGLGLDHERGHFLRAAFEGVAFGLRRGLETLAVSGVPVTTVHVSGGGARDQRWLQLLADVFGRPVRVDSTPNVAARGAALLAAAAAGVDIAALRRDPVGETLLPGPAAGMYADLYADSLELYPHLSQLSAVP
jgi:xylulokinase